MTRDDFLAGLVHIGFYLIAVLTNVLILKYGIEGEFQAFFVVLGFIPIVNFVTGGVLILIEFLFGLVTFIAWVTQWVVA